MPSSEPATLLREMLYPFTIVAPGSMPAILSTVPDQPLPPCEENGMIVLPEKSYASKNEYIGI